MVDGGLADLVDGGWVWRWIKCGWVILSEGCYKVELNFMFPTKHRIGIPLDRRGE